jgi:hypothetical protein
VCLASCGDYTPTRQAQPVDATSSPSPWFEEIAAGAGIDFTHDSGHRDRFYFPESVCGGAALVDVDNDGWLDIYLIQGRSLSDPFASAAKHPGNRLYRNLGNGRFADITEGSGAGVAAYGMGIATGDFDNDADVDLYLANLGPNVLLRNDGGGRFIDITSLARVGHDGFGSGCAFLDYDADGWLDLFALNYVHWSIGAEGYCTAPDGLEDYCSPKTYRAPTLAVLYHNNRDGTYTDVTAQAGLGEARGNGLGVVCGDFNGDGRIDLYIANDATPNRLWINLGDGRFADRAMELGCAIDEAGTAKAGMGVDAVDLDDDGDLDVLVGNLFTETDSFFRNEGEYFMDATAALGLAAPSRRFTRFGLALRDFDNDSYLDVFEANGKVFRVPPFWSDDRYAEPNQLFRGTAAGRFEEVSPRGGTAASLLAASRAAAFGDINNDGRIDILVVNRDGRPHLLRNITGGGGHWIMFRVLDEHGRDALGATVSIKLGDRIVRRDVRTAYSYLAANDPRVHFGLGAQGLATDVAVAWPNGSRESFGEFEADQIVTLRRPPAVAR